MVDGLVSIIMPSWNTERFIGETIQSVLDQTYENWELIIVDDCSNDCTDTEVVIKLVDYYYRKYNLGPVDAIAKTMVRVRGSYALELMFQDYPGEIWVARKDSGLRLNMPVRMMCSLSEGELIMRFPWRAVLN